MQFLHIPKSGVKGELTEMFFAVGFIKKESNFSSIATSEIWMEFIFAFLGCFLFNSFKNAAAVFSFS
ncbi:hypothetical protein BKM63_22930 [Flavobacterium johnsoniae]|uniref:Uncharacterized protein n=1 Tax=Flavobacterium johnsoniae TaxID=986 RepID=A0A1J7CDS2_FLAJO|nr:hypothetical protein BKM63_22930 [Flavobacterium johnsoniae]